MDSTGDEDRAPSIAAPLPNIPAGGKLKSASYV